MLFLDVDGPINPDEDVDHEFIMDWVMETGYEYNDFYNRYEWPDYWGDWIPYDIIVAEGAGLMKKYVVRLSSKQTQAIYDAAGGKIQWFSTWCDYEYLPPWEEEDGFRPQCLANRYLAPLIGWEPLPYIPYVENDTEWWKFTQIKYLAEAELLPDRWVWADDDFWKTPGIIDWCRQHGGLALPVKSHIGLTPYQIGVIDDWLCS